MLVYWFSIKLLIYFLAIARIPLAYRWVLRLTFLTLLNTPLRLNVISVTTLDYCYA
jgi:hypothetical protein